MQIDQKLRSITTALFISVLVACNSQAPNPQLSARAAPLFELQDVHGRMQSLQQIQEPVVIIHFWASWCPPCLEEIPRWIAAGPTMKDFPVKLVAISVDENWEKALKVLPISKLSPNMMLLLDPKNEVAGKYGTRQFPESYVLNRNRQIVEKWIGSQDWTGSMVRFGIAKALAQSQRSK